MARSLKVNIPQNLEEVHLNHVLHKQSESATSSLNRDITAGKKNELDVFSGELLKIAAENQLKIPMT